MKAINIIYLVDDCQKYDEIYLIKKLQRTTIHTNKLLSNFKITICLLLYLMDFEKARSNETPSFISLLTKFSVFNELTLSFVYRGRLGRNMNLTRNV